MSSYSKITAVAWMEDKSPQDVIAHCKTRCSDLPAVDFLIRLIQSYIGRRTSSGDVMVLHQSPIIVGHISSLIRDYPDRFQQR